MSKDAIDDVMAKGEKSECVTSIVTGGHESVLSLDKYTTPVEILCYECVTDNQNYDMDMVNDQVTLVIWCFTSKVNVLKN